MSCPRWLRRARRISQWARDAVSELAFLGGFGSARATARAESGARSRHRTRGAREALIELYGEHYAPLVRLAHLVAHDPSIAEDLVHEAFIKLYGSWHRVRDHDRAPAYLRTTLVNLARGRARRHHVALRRRPAPAPDAASAEEGALGAENRREVVECLRSAPDPPARVPRAAPLLRHDRDGDRRHARHLRRFGPHAHQAGYGDAPASTRCPAMIGPDELHELLHAHAATIEPVPHLAELGAGLTAVERHRRDRVVVGTTIVVVAVAAAVTTVRTIETARRTGSTPHRPHSGSWSHPTRRRRSRPRSPRSSAAPRRRDADRWAPGAASGHAVTPAPAAPQSRAPAERPPPAIGACEPRRGRPGRRRLLTFRAASVSDLSPANPPAVDYFGIAPPGVDGHRDLDVRHRVDPGRTRRQVDDPSRARRTRPSVSACEVVLSAPPLPALTFNFTHTAG